MLRRAVTSPIPYTYKMPSSERDNEVKKILFLDRELVNKFNELEPIHGSFTWFVREAMTKYVQLKSEVEHSNDVVERAVRELISEQVRKDGA